MPSCQIQGQSHKLESKGRAKGSQEPGEPESTGMEQGRASMQTCWSCCLVLSLEIDGEAAIPTDTGRRKTLG